ncbi:MAG: hypothetical protein K0S76_1858 [Herbinix sp.]|jgi:hypothetical protein|nr:hypothetical protein [Herbinix sp.]
MEYDISLKLNKGKAADSLQESNQNFEANDQGLHSLKTGQQISGQVVSAEDEVIINFSGYTITAPKSSIKDAKAGEERQFEVLKVTNKEIELKVLPKDAGTIGQSEDTYITDLEQKEYNPSFQIMKNQENLLGQKQTGKQARKDRELSEIKNHLEQITLRFTGSDCYLLEQGGFPVESLTIEELDSALNRIKQADPKGVKSGIAGPKALTEESFLIRLKSENLPPTTENLQKITSALKLSSVTTEMNDRTMKYLIANDMEPTIENIYKAFYSGNTGKQEEVFRLPKEEWIELKQQAEGVLQASGYEVNEENLETARWLIENKLPLTTETLREKKELEELKVKSNPDTILDQIIMGMKRGISPMDVPLTARSEKSYDKLITDIHSVTEDTVIQAAKNNPDITLRDLIQLQSAQPAQSQRDKANGTSVLAQNHKPVDELFYEEAAATEMSEVEIPASDINKDEYETIKAKRQLEEIRLKMTTEAAARLEKKGISVETERLQRVVEALREQEKSYYQGLFQEAGVKADGQQLKLLTETVESIKELKLVPSYVLGATLQERKLQTIPELVKVGSRLQTELIRAGEAYETLMTIPNREYGDTIQKAFKHMDSLLNELGIDNTELNQRAVRILGYNNMEITEEAISRVKAYDLEVTDLIRNMQPAVVVRMIKEGINPLNMPIGELNKTVDQKKDEMGITAEEKFSTYLRKLEKTENISEEERKAYIGIYRLLYNIEKSDGAALGAVVKAGRTVTLDSLLTAVRTGKKGRFHSVVDDEFGALEQLSRKGETITDQINAGFALSGEAGAENVPSKKEMLFEQTEYVSRLLKLMKEEITPDKLNSVNESVQSGALPVGHQESVFAPQLSSKKGIWDALSGIPVEEIYDRLKQVEEATAAEGQFYEEKVREIRDLFKNCDQAVRFLNEYKVPGTAVNIMMANHLLTNGESPLKRLIKQQSEKAVENSENSVKEIEKLTDTLIDRNSINETYENLEKEAKTAIERACSEEIIDSKRLAELKSIGMQMTFLRTLASREFYQIPVETKDGFTNMNLTIIRGSESTGKLGATIISNHLGNVRAEISLKDKTIKGFVSCDNKNTVGQLQKHFGEIELVAKEEGLAIKQLDFGIQKKGNESYSYQSTEHGANSINQDTERILYRIAKALVVTVRSAELEAE